MSKQHYSSKEEELRLLRLERTYRRGAIMASFPTPGKWIRKPFHITSTSPHTDQSPIEIRYKNELVFSGRYIDYWGRLQNLHVNEISVYVPGSDTWEEDLKKGFTYWRSKYGKEADAIWKQEQEKIFRDL